MSEDNPYRYFKGFINLHSILLWACLGFTLCSSNPIRPFFITKKPMEGMNGKMFTINNLVKPESLDQAYHMLMDKKNNTLLGGTAFLRMGCKRIATAIDLSELELDYIKEQESYIEIGAYTTLRELETSQLLIHYFNGIIPNSLKNIIGVQFRNIVTVGASIFSKYGFSDLLTSLLVLDTEIELYQGGRMTLNEFLNRPREKDILTKIFIKKNERKASYKDLRNSVSDYPILNVAVSKLNHQWTIAVGARPQKACIATRASEEISKHFDIENLDDYSNIAAGELSFGTNMRGTKEYRQAMSKVLIKRAIMEVLQCK